ncbi:sporulation protein YunB [Oceanobacillus chungangensis]|uniref:Sporulation protein YunB n=1 Tax=Oceanobacillus chungangensis TaxID=1229152 RepID=A0A3D8Q1R0_9BACI|nr:sporulation protein YunB [Oceanobacillus chungangensis]RDW20945.1 sporulation protein YunB [Oceanobacillus chungangensis]
MFGQRRRFGKKRGSPPAKGILIITMILFLLIIMVNIWIIDKGIQPTLMDIAEMKTDEFATRAINSAVRFAEGYSFEDFVNITYDNEGHPAIYGYNPVVMNEITRGATERVEEFFQYVNRGEPYQFDYPLEEVPEYSGTAESMAGQDPTLVEIPLGQVTRNTVLANLGPKIPVNLEVIGSVRTNIKRDVEDFGINGAWLSLYLQVEADVQIIIPFTTEVHTVSKEIYLDGGAIMSKVPDYYGGDGGGPSIAIPKDDLHNN